MNGFRDESPELNQIPDEVTLQLRLPTGLAYAFRELAKAYIRLGKTSEEAAHMFVEHLAELAAHS
jgi:hypothetical protein